MHPREFGKFRIVKLLPLGGMGRVYLALHGETDQPVALKLIEHGPNPEQGEIVEAERRGAILQARLCGLDPRVTVIHSFGDLDDFFFIEMEYVEGQDLSELLAKAPLGVPFAARIGRDICQVLQHAHNFTAEIEGQQYHGIVHGDIKPRNIRITPDGQVKVLDFGIAKALSLTRKFTTNRFGSSQYSSPERLNNGEVDVASDLWSVAVVLFEIVTGKPYFESDNSAKLEHEIRNYRSLRPLPESLPARFRAILWKALHPDLAQRYSSAEEFASDLTAFLENRTASAEAMPVDDDESTRRVGAVPGDATRRTSAPAPPPLPLPKSMKPVAPKVYKPLTQKQRQVRFLIAAAVTVLIAVMFLNEASAWRRGAALKRELETEQLTDLGAAWTRYEALAKSSFLPVLLSGPRNAVQSRLIATADRTLGEYRSEAPNIRESDWVKARASLARALELDPGDKQIRGKMYLCEGHIARIKGDSRTALSKFEEARDLMNKSPDPYLGLARLYVYNLKDVERAEEALRNADKRGHDLGRREKAQLADGFKDRAERLMREAVRAAGLQEEKDYLEKARSDYRRAEELYREIVPFGGSTASLRRIFEQMEILELRLDAIKGGD